MLSELKEMASKGKGKQAPKSKGVKDDDDWEIILAAEALANGAAAAAQLKKDAVKVPDVPVEDGEGSDGRSIVWRAGAGIAVALVAFDGA